MMRPMRRSTNMVEMRERALRFWGALRRRRTSSSTSQHEERTVSSVPPVVEAHRERTIVEPRHECPVQPEPSRQDADTVVKSVTREEESAPSQKVCVVCFEEVEEDPGLKLPCGHDMWHADCCRKWLNVANRCPLCNIEVPCRICERMPRELFLILNERRLPTLIAATTAGRRHVWSAHRRGSGDVFVVVIPMYT